MEHNNSNIRFLSSISYLGILFVIGHFAVEKDNPDLRFHTFQGGVLFTFFIIDFSFISDFYFCFHLGFVPCCVYIITRISA